jgi:hypothetical protein
MISVGTATSMGLSMGLPPWDVPSFVYSGGTFPQGQGGIPVRLRWLPRAWRL